MRRSGKSDPSDIPLESKIAFLQRPSSYPPPCSQVEAIETHMSWVFLAGQHAYKLKKPVAYNGVDLRNGSARRRNCEEEVRLNRRLAPDVYLGVVPLGLDWRHQLTLAPLAEPVDWLVHMRRLARRDMLDSALRDMRVGVADVVRVARRLAAFYRAAAHEPMAQAEVLARLAREIVHNRQVLCAPAYPLEAESNAALCDAQLHALRLHAQLFAARPMVEGHGDLRPEHVCIRPQVLVIDCIEFSRALRLADPLDEIAFLTLEVERLSGNGLSEALLRAYCDAAGDHPPLALVHFYKSLRAAVRARLSIRHLDEPRFAGSAEWIQRTQDYLQLARKYQDALSPVSEPPS